MVSVITILLALVLWACVRLVHLARRKLPLLRTFLWGPVHQNLFGEPVTVTVTASAAPTLSSSAIFGEPTVIVSATRQQEAQQTQPSAPIFGRVTVSRPGLCLVRGIPCASVDHCLSRGCRHAA